MSENNLIKRINEKKESMWEIKASHLSEEKEVYFKRALISIMHNEGLANISKTEKGAASIMFCISKALQLGLQLGGHIPHAHIVPYKDKTELVPTAEGFKFIVLCEPKIIKNFFVRAVHEGEKFEIDFAANTVVHSYDGKKPLGKLVGIWGEITDMQNKKIIEYMSRHEIEEVRNNHSKSYAAFKGGKLSKSGCVWETDFKQLAIKTAIKRFLKPYVALKEGMNMSFEMSSNVAADESNITADVEPEIDKRMSSHLDNIIDAETVQNEPVKQEQAQPAPQNDKKEKEIW